MAIKIIRYQKTLNSIAPLKDDYGSNNKQKTHYLNITDNIEGLIGAVSLKYVYTPYGDKEFIQFPEAQITTDKVIFSNQRFTISFATTYGDMDNPDILIKSNINIYKMPHKGWNFRLYKNIIFNIMVDGGVSICM